MLRNPAAPSAVCHAETCISVIFPDCGAARVTTTSSAQPAVLLCLTPQVTLPTLLVLFVS